MTADIDIRRFEKIKASGELPSPRGVALAVIRQAQNPDVSMADMARVIKGDPAFVARLVKTANGLVAGNRRAVVSVQEALMVLGLPAVRTMALGFSLLSNYRRGACANFDYERFWSGSVLMALAMSMVSQRARAMAADEAFSLGLLAGIGKLALATLYPLEYAGVLEEWQQGSDARLLELERKSLAIDHCDLAAAMLLDWGFPQVLANAVQHYHKRNFGGVAANSRDERLMRSLALAQAVTDFYLAPTGDQAERIAALQRQAGQLGVEQADFISLCERVGGEWVEWGRLLHIQVGELPQFKRLLTKKAGDAGTAVQAQGADGGGGGGAEEGLAATAAQGAAVSPMCLLHVGSRDSIDAHLQASLDGTGMTLHQVEHGSQAVVALVDIQPQVMLIDWRAHDGGPDLVRVVRETRLGRAIYIIAVVDSDDEKLLLAASAAGVDDFVVRPVRTSVLRMRLQVGRRMVRLQRELEREREELRRFAAELSISNRRLQEAAMTDALTGFPNRRYLVERLQTEWSAALRHKRPLAVLIIDLDGFKSINDEHGHDVGDMVLRETTACMRTVVRASDVICRTGGDEFLVICPDTGLDAGHICAERLRKAVAALVIDPDGVSVRLSISIGVAARTDAMDSPEQLVKCADRGAYLAKEQGRNRVASIQRGELE